MFYLLIQLTHIGMCSSNNFLFLWFPLKQIKSHWYFWSIFIFFHSIYLVIKDPIFCVEFRELSAWFIFCQIHTKIAPAQPLMFWLRFRYNKDLRSKKQQVSRPSLENEAPKVSRFQHVKISSSDCPIVPRFGFCSYFWKWRPPR